MYAAGKQYTSATWTKGAAVAGGKRKDYLGAVVSGNSFYMVIDFTVAG